MATSLCTSGIYDPSPLFWRQCFWNWKTSPSLFFSGSGRRFSCRGPLRFLIYRAGDPAFWRWPCTFQQARFWTSVLPDQCCARACPSELSFRQWNLCRKSGQAQDRIEVLSPSAGCCGLTPLYQNLDSFEARFWNATRKRAKSRSTHYSAPVELPRDNCFRSGRYLTCQ